MLAGASVYSQVPMMESMAHSEYPPFEVERKTGASARADLGAMIKDPALDVQETPAGPGKLLGALLSGGAEMAKSRSYEPGESRFKKVGTFAAPCTSGGGAKRCSTSE